VILKEKRDYIVGHDPEYIELLGKLNASGELRQVGMDINLYALVSNSDVAIAIRNTSAALVATTLNKSSMCYDPSEVMVANHEQEDLLFFASNSEQLESHLVDALNLAIVANSATADFITQG